MELKVDRIIIILMDGVLYASWIFLVAIGLTLIFGVMRILNIAHGSLYSFGAYVSAVFVLAYFRQGLWPPAVFIVIIMAAILTGFIVGPLMERLVLQRMYRKEISLQLLTTYALFLILEDVMKLIFGTSPFYAYEPLFLVGTFQTGGITYPRYYLIIMLVAIVCGLLLWLFMKKSAIGKQVVSVIHDPEISQIMGLNLPKIYVITFSIGASLAAMGGAFTAPILVVVPGLSVEVIVISFAVVVIGGLGSLGGAALGALIVGVVRAAAVHYLPVMELFTIYIVMALILLIKPLGLFPMEEARKI